MKLKFNLILILVILFAACEEPNSTDDGTAAPGNGIADTQPIGQISPPTVYVAGYEYETPGTSTAKYWKDGVETELPVPDIPSYTFSGAKAASIFVNGTDIYIAGQISYMDSESYDYSSAAYWKDDGITIEAFILDDAIANSSESMANDIFFSGSNIYAVGYKTVESTPGVYLQNATLWISDNTTITETTLENINSGVVYFAEAKAVFVDASGVYVAGQGKTSLNGSYRAMYWLNGTRIVEGPEGNESCFEDIVADGTSIYTAGWFRGENTSPFYWKNDEGISNLKDSSGGTSGHAYAIAIDGSDIYTAGTSEATHSLASYWENKEAKEFINGEYKSTACSIAAEGSYIYFAGIERFELENEIATYWKCEKSPGTAYIKTPLTDTENKGYATSIFVVK